MQPELPLARVSLGWSRRCGSGMFSATRAGRSPIAMAFQYVFSSVAADPASARRSIKETLSGFPRVSTGWDSVVVKNGLPSTRIRARTTYEWPSWMRAGS